MIDRVNKSLLPRYIVVIAWMALIFVFSHQVSDVSSGQSSLVVAAVYEVTGVESSQTVVRKSAHAVVYLVLGILCLWLVRGHGASWQKAAIISLVIAFAYACSDELHQTLIPGRSAEMADVLLDTAASGIGILACLMVRDFTGKYASNRVD